MSGAKDTKSKGTTFSVQQLTNICIDEVIPQLGHAMLLQNTNSIRSFLFTNQIDSDKLFSIKQIELRDSLVTYSSNNIKRGPANKLIHALKSKVHKEEIYDANIVNELAKQGVASKYELIFASKQTQNYKNMDDVLFRVTRMKNSHFYNKITDDKIIPVDYGPSVLLVPTKQFLMLAHLSNINILYKIREDDVLICGYCRIYLPIDITNYIAKYYFSVYSYANMIKLSGTMSIIPMDCKSGYLLKATGIFPTARIDVPVPKKCGKYYYEFVINFVSRSSLGQIGLVDSAFKPSNSNGEGVGDDEHSWAFDGGRRSKWHCGRKGAYGKHWHVDDVVGCGVHVKDAKKNIFDIEFYLNGKSLGVAWQNCKYKGNLYAAFTTGSKDDYGTMVFDKDKLKYMPEGFGPIF